MPLQSEKVCLVLVCLLCLTIATFYFPTKKPQIAGLECGEGQEYLARPLKEWFVFIDFTLRLPLS